MQLEHRPNYNNFAWNIVRQKWLKWIKIHAEYSWKEFSVINKFQCQQKDWSARFKFFRRHALLVSPFAGLYYFLGTLKTGAWREGFWGWKIALGNGLYYFLLWVWIWRLRK